MTSRAMCCGEAIVDFIAQPDGSYVARPGGSPLISAVALGRLGANVQLLARIGADTLGYTLRDFAVGSNVELVNNLVDVRSTLALASLDENGAAKYEFYLEGCGDGTWSATDVPDAADVDYLVLSGSIALCLPNMAAAFDLLIARAAPRATLLFDPNIRPATVRNAIETRERVERWVQHASIVKVSEEDIHWYAPTNTNETLKRWASDGTLVLLTRGADGATAFVNDTEVAVSAPTTAVVDTVGAGDTFTAAIVHWLLQSKINDLSGLKRPELDQALTFANAMAAETCTRAGGDPPWPAEPPG